MTEMIIMIRKPSKAHTAKSLRNVYQSLLDAYGPQDWWPAKTPFEVMVGAVLTQNTAWTNVERAIANLRRARCLTARAIVNCPVEALAEHLRPSGYFNLKAKRLRSFCTWYLERGGYRRLRGLDTEDLRAELLAVNGVGPETADDILLYAFERPVFVIDAYTRRLLARLKLIEGDEDYETLRAMVEQALEPDVVVFNEFHALIVQHAKQSCRKKPVCDGCCLGACP